MRDWVMLIIKERASGPDSERDTYILCGSICHATYVLNGRATIIDMSYRLFTWESYHALYLVWEFATGVLHGRATMKLSTRKCKRFTWDLRPCVHKFYLYCTITTHSIPDCSRPALPIIWNLNLKLNECQADIYCILVRNDDTLSNRAGLMSDLVTK